MLFIITLVFNRQRGKQIITAVNTNDVMNINKGENSVLIPVILNSSLYISSTKDHSDISPSLPLVSIKKSLFTLTNKGRGEFGGPSLFLKLKTSLKAENKYYTDRTNRIWGKLTPRTWHVSSVSNLWVMEFWRNKVITFTFKYIVCFTSSLFTTSLNSLLILCSAILAILKYFYPKSMHQRIKFLSFLTNKV